MYGAVIPEELLKSRKKSVVKKCPRFVKLNKIGTPTADDDDKHRTLVQIKESSMSLSENQNQTLLIPKMTVLNSDNSSQSSTSTFFELPRSPEVISTGGPSDQTATSPVSQPSESQKMFNLPPSTAISLSFQTTHSLSPNSQLLECPDRSNEGSIYSFPTQIPTPDFRVFQFVSQSMVDAQFHGGISLNCNQSQSSNLGSIMDSNHNYMQKKLHRTTRKRNRNDIDVCMNSQKDTAESSQMTPSFGTSGKYEDCAIQISSSFTEQENVSSISSSSLNTQTFDNVSLDHTYSEEMKICPLLAQSQNYENYKHDERMTNVVHESIKINKDKENSLTQISPKSYQRLPLLDSNMDFLVPSIKRRRLCFDDRVPVSPIVKDKFASDKIELKIINTENTDDKDQPTDLSKRPKFVSARNIPEETDVLLIDLLENNDQSTSSSILDLSKTTSDIMSHFLSNHCCEFFKSYDGSSQISEHKAHSSTNWQASFNVRLDVIKQAIENALKTLENL